MLFAKIPTLALHVASEQEFLSIVGGASGQSLGTAAQSTTSLPPQLASGLATVTHSFVVRDEGRLGLHLVSISCTEAVNDHKIYWSVGYLPCQWQLQRSSHWGLQAGWTGRKGTERMWSSPVREGISHSGDQRFRLLR